MKHSVKTPSRSSTPGLPDLKSFKEKSLSKPKSSISNSILHKIEILAKDMLENEKLLIQKRRYNIKLWKFILLDSFRDIDEVPFPDDLDMLLIRHLDKDYNIWLEYSKKREQAIWEMPNERIFHYCKKYNLKMPNSNLTIPLDILQKGQP